MAFESEMLAALRKPFVIDEERISSFGISPSQVRTTRRSSVHEAMRLPNTKLLLQRASREHVHLSDVAAAAVAAAMLRLGRSDERDMCKRLVRLAARFFTVGEPCFRNLQLNGRPVNFVEDGKLWTLLTSNSAESQNVVEFDFVANAEMRRNASVAFVQSYWRKVLRSERWDMRRQRGEAARTIQRWWRSVDLTSIRYNRSGEEIVRNL